MLCYATACCALLYYVTVLSGMALYVVLCQAMVCYGMRYYAVLFNGTLSGFVMLCCAVV